MSKRNPDPNPELFELATSLKPDTLQDTIVLNQAPLPGFQTPTASMPAAGGRGAYHIWTIGCQMNVADSNHVAAELERIGFRPTDAIDEADVVVLNTCVVRQSAEDKGIGKASNLKPWKKARSNRTLALMGCMVGVKPSLQLQDRFPHVDVFMPPSEPAPLITFLQKEEIASESTRIEREQLALRHALQDDEQLPLAGQSIRRLSMNGEAAVCAHVPVVYGCSHACTFCIIPFRRGIERSRPVDEIVHEVGGLVAQGVREVTLLGQIVDRYGHDWRNGANGENGGPGKPDLADLLHAVHEIEGLWRIRFLTSHPNYMSDRILEAVRDLPKVCEHIEVPIQAGNDQVLARMKRGYTQTQYRGLIEHIRATVPQAAINTDIIVGFCGEEASQFDETYQLLADLKLDKAHLARYSPRPGTVSERRMADDVPEDEKVRRHKALEKLQEQVCGEINARLLGETVELLIEGEHKGKWRGRTRQNKLVFVNVDDRYGDLRGRLVEAQITWTGPWSMQGRFARDVSPAEA
ncbi:MAG: MiaB/RimO family radical SAM methylthiotransferase [Caldilineaceae bacterium]|nr:MiaB/RimO family radical SAM methylthiotransferase [Caldilineaceae bacterium]MDE0336859.1 MiaB/RimO family radical SAM methylthiotransferase [Caldilineaceae bacterium]